MEHLRRLRLNLDGHRGWIGGVCAGFARYINTDPTFVRVGTVVTALFFPKLVIATYLVSWLVLNRDA